MPAALCVACGLHLGLIAAVSSKTDEPRHSVSRSSMISISGLDFAEPAPSVAPPAATRDVLQPKSRSTSRDHQVPSGSRPRLPMRLSSPEGAPSDDGVQSDGDADPDLPWTDLAGLGSEGDLLHGRGGLSRVGGAGGRAIGGAVPVGAKLLAASARCSDLFPADAAVDHAVAVVAVRVAGDGEAEFERLEDVQPARQGFELAARLCASRLKFSPASDDRGRRVAAVERVRLSFERQN